MNLPDIVIDELRKKTFSIVTVLSLILLAKALLLCLPFLMKAAVDSLIYEPNWATGLAIYPPLIVAAYAVTFFLASLFEEIKEYLSEKTIQPAISEVTRKIFCLIQNLPISFYIDSKTGSLLKDLDRMLKALQSLSALLLYTVLPLTIEILAVLAIFFIGYELEYVVVVFIGILVHGAITLYATPRLVSERKN